MPVMPTAFRYVGPRAPPGAAAGGRRPGPRRGPGHRRVQHFDRDGHRGRHPRRRDAGLARGELRRPGRATASPVTSSGPSRRTSARCCATTSGSRSRAGSTSPTPPTGRTSTTTPSAIPAPGGWCAPTGWAPSPSGCPARPGKSWSSGWRRCGRPISRPPPAIADTSLASLDPEARAAFERMLAAARRAGHRVKVVETHRTSERQAFLMASGGGLTFTATSKHSSGRAVDLIVGDGNLKHPRTRARWTAFRRWVTHLRRRPVPADRRSRRLLGLAPHRAGRPHGVPIDRSAAARREARCLGGAVIN